MWSAPRRRPGEIWNEQMIHLADDLKEHGAQNKKRSASVFSISGVGRFLTGWPSYLLLGHDPKLALPGFCLVSSQEGFFPLFFFFLLSSLVFFWSWKPATPQMVWFCFFFCFFLLFCGLHILGVDPRYSTDVGQDLRRIEVERARKTRLHWSERINHHMYPFFWAFFFFLNGNPKLFLPSNRSNGSRTRKQWAPRFQEKILRALRKRMGRSGTNGVLGRESYVQTEERSYISPWNPTRRGTVAFINTIQAQTELVLGNNRIRVQTNCDISQNKSKNTVNMKAEQAAFSMFQVNTWVETSSFLLEPDLSFFF